MNLTPIESQCLKAIRRLTVDKVAPSIEELRIDLGKSSRSEVARIIDKLEAAGYIRRGIGPRNIVVCDPLDVIIGELVTVHGREAVRAALGRVA